MTAKPWPLPPDSAPAPAVCVVCGEPVDERAVVAAAKGGGG
jgi:hypothetical protein